MLIYSQKRKKIADCAAISVERIVGGGKEGKFALMRTEVSSKSILPQL